MSRNDPAFPSHGSMGEVVHEGLTKREEFAKAAMQGLRASGHPMAPTFSDEIARIAVEDADALLAELAKERA